MVEQILGEQVVLEGTIREGRRSCHFTIRPDPGQGIK